MAEDTIAAANGLGATATANASVVKGAPVSDTNIWIDPPAGAAFQFDKGNRVQFRDGRNVRHGFVTRRGVRDTDGKQGYEIIFMARETGQIRLVWWMEFDLSAGTDDAFAFKKGDKVVVNDGAGDKGQEGAVFDRIGMSIDRLEPQYAVMIDTKDGKSDLAWWSESSLVAAS